MGPLNNPRWERFTQALFEGKSADEAYVKAGYSENRGNASRLKANENVSARLAELQAQAAADSKVTVESICRELDEANAVAKAKGQAAAMVSAATLRAKLAGLMVEKVEVGKPNDFDGPDMTVADIANAMIDRMVAGFHPVDEADRQGYIALVNRHCDEMQEYLDAIRARPIVAQRVDVRFLEKPWQSHEPYSATVKLAKKSNGSK